MPSRKRRPSKTRWLRGEGFLTHWRRALNRCHAEGARILRGTYVASKTRVTAGLTTKDFYDGLLRIRRQVRNFVAHGSFRKEGEAFQFHSTAGVVLMRMVEGRDANFIFGAGEGYADKQAIQFVHDYVSHLWSGAREPAFIYIRESGLPLILTMAANGVYVRCITSTDDITSFRESRGTKVDRYLHMGFRSQGLNGVARTSAVPAPCAQLL